VVDLSEKRLELTLNLRDAYKAPKLRRAKRAINLLRTKITRISKAQRVRLSNELVSYIWSRGAEKPPRKVPIVVERGEEGVVDVKLRGEGDTGE
jgi:large subunit ribosomal protein L31e